MKVAATFGGRELCLDEGIVEAHGVVIGRGLFLIVGRGGGGPGMMLKSSCMRCELMVRGKDLI